MSLTIPVGYGLANFVHTSTEGTQPFVCTIGVDMTGAGPDFVGAANSLFSDWGLSILPIMDSDLTLSKVTLAIGSVGPGGSVDSTRTPVVGGRSTTGLPWSLSAIATKRTGQLGRSGRGRMFIPGLVATTEVGQGGSISTTRRNAIQAALDSLNTNMNIAGGAGEYVMRPYLLHSNPALPPTAIEGFSLAPLVGWIRKRIR